VRCQTPAFLLTDKRTRTRMHAGAWRKYRHGLCGLPPRLPTETRAKLLTGCPLCMCVCMHVCMCACMYVFVHVCMCVYVIYTMISCGCCVGRASLYEMICITSLYEMICITSLYEMICITSLYQMICITSLYEMICITSLYQMICIT